MNLNYDMQMCQNQGTFDRKESTESNRESANGGNMSLVKNLI